MKNSQTWIIIKRQLLKVKKTLENFRIYEQNVLKIVEVQLHSNTKENTWKNGMKRLFKISTIQRKLSKLGNKACGSTKVPRLSKTMKNKRHQRMLKIKICLKCC